MRGSKTYKALLNFTSTEFLNKESINYGGGFCVCFCFLTNMGI